MIHSCLHRLKQHWMLLAILLLAAALRFWNIGANSFVADEFLDMNSSYGYFRTGEWQAWDFNHSEPNTDNINKPRDERAWGYKMQVAALFHFLPPTEGVARSISALWGILGVLIAYGVAYSFTRRRGIALFTAFFIAISISSLEMDRRLRMYAMFAPIFLAFSWSVFQFFEREYRGKWKSVAWISKRFGVHAYFLFPAIALGALSLHLHLLTVTIVPIVFAYALTELLFVLWKQPEERTWKRIAWNKYAITLSIMIAGWIGITLASPFIERLVSDSLSFPDNHYGYFPIVTKDYASAMLAIIVFFIGTNALLVRKSVRKSGVWILLSFLVPLFLSVFAWRRNVGDQYIFFAQSFKSIIIAAGAYGIVLFCKKHLAETYGRKAFLVPIILVLLLLPNWGYFFEENTTYHQNSKSSNPNYRKVFTYVVKYHIPGDALITREFRNYYWSGTNMPTYTFGGELSKTRVQIVDIERIMAEYPTGWVVLSDNDQDYIAGDAEQFIEANMDHISNSEVRGNIDVYRWGTGEEK